ncbi:hypothetical protein [Bosea sp. RAC05]|uniref:hypothetical protein n=1 Tax=Bosea sp. RAC05 TaxID=1842539 RepID=UPI00083CDC43|nr:hypothetical protein [Bosea sp. RAC05]AOG03149.1 hypothetical protein BSY19_4897 [Bosea sp. RAC05]
MPIPLEREPQGLDRGSDRGSEHCCFCYVVTPYWYPKKDVAVCLVCAAEHDVDEVPVKRDWCAAVQDRFPWLRETRY